MFEANSLEDQGRQADRAVQVYLWHQEYLEVRGALKVLEAPVNKSNSYNSIGLKFFKTKTYIQERYQQNSFLVQNEQNNIAINYINFTCLTDISN